MDADEVAAPSEAPPVVSRLTVMRRTISSQRDNAFLAAGLLVPAGASTFAVLVTSARLGPAGRGSIAFVLTAVVVAMSFSTFGLFVPASRVRGAVPRSYEGALCAMTAGVSLLIVGAGLIVNSEPFTVMTAAAVAIGSAATAFTVYSQRVLQARVAASFYLILAVLPSVGLLAATAAIFVRDSVAVFLSVWLVGALVAAVVAMVVLHSRVEFVGPVFTRIWAAIKEAWPIAFSLLSTMLVYRSPTVILGFVSTVDEVGYFSFAASIANLLWFPAEVLGLRAVGLHATAQTHSEYRHKVRRLASLAMLAAAAMGFLVSGLSLLLIPRFLPVFEPALLPLVVLAIASIPTAWARVLMMACGMTSRNRILRLYSRLGLALSILFVPASASAGAMGAALASLIVYSITAIPFLGEPSIELDVVPALTEIPDDVGQPD